MGLLLGASAVTVCEFLDVIIYNFFRKAANGSKKTTITKNTEKDYKDNPAFSPDIA